MDERFRRHWERWRARVDGGVAPARFLQECSDETLVELLAYAEGGSALERNIIATELTNRISRLHRDIAGHSARVRGLVAGNRGALAEVARGDDEIERESDRHEAETSRTSRHMRKPRDGDW